MIFTLWDSWREFLTVSSTFWLYSTLSNLSLVYSLIVLKLNFITGVNLQWVNHRRSVSKASTVFENSDLYLSNWLAHYSFWVIRTVSDLVDLLPSPLLDLWSLVGDREDCYSCFLSSFLIKAYKLESAILALITYELRIILRVFQPWYKARSYFFICLSF